MSIEQCRAKLEADRIILFFRPELTSRLFLPDIAKGGRKQRLDEGLEPTPVCSNGTVGGEMHQVRDCNLK